MPMWLGTKSTIRPMPWRMEVGHEGIEVLARPDLGIELVVVVDVVSMHAAGRRLEQRRRIHMADAQIVEIRHHLTRLLEGEVLIELEAVGRCGDAWSRVYHESDFSSRSSGPVKSTLFVGAWNGSSPEPPKAWRIRGKDGSPRPAIVEPAEIMRAQVNLASAIQ